MAILKIKDANGNFVTVPALVGPAGADAIAGSAIANGTQSAFTATIDGITALTQDLMIVIFPYVNNTANATLNLNNLGAKPIYYKGAKVTASRLPKDAAILLIYDMVKVSGGAWHAIFSYDSDNTCSNAGLGNGYGLCATAADTVAKTATLTSYALSTQGRVSIKFEEAVPAAATLNINTRGAKAIYYKGAAIEDGIIVGGDIVTFVYNGTQYEVVNIYREAEQTLTPGEHISFIDGAITVDDLGNFDNLKTASKDLLVNAINELVDKDTSLSGDISAVEGKLTTSTENLQSQINSINTQTSTASTLQNDLMTLNTTSMAVGSSNTKLQMVADGDQFNIANGDNSVLNVGTTQVSAPNLSVGNTLTTGYHQFKKYARSDGQLRTGMFWVGDE